MAAWCQHKLLPGANDGACNVGYRRQAIARHRCTRCRTLFRCTLAPLSAASNYFRRGADDRDTGRDDDELCDQQLPSSPAAARFTVVARIRYAILPATDASCVALPIPSPA